MLKADEFRAQAVRCDELAAASKNTEAQGLYRQAADEWRLLAVQTERQERGFL